MQDQLRIYRQILYDLVLHHLEPLQGNYSRLAFVAALRDPTTGIYGEKALIEAYGLEPVHQALSRCHEELFERVLELPLARQQEDLGHYVGTQGGPGTPSQTTQGEILESWIPPRAPGYLKELFRSNLSALFELLRDRRSKVRSGT